MLRLATLLLLPLVLGSVRAHAAAFDSTAARARATELRASIGAGDAARLWAAFGPGMRSAMKDSANFATMAAGMAQQLGAVDSVLGERIEPNGEGWTVLTTCRFARAPTPLVLSTSFDAGGRVEGLSVRSPRSLEAAPSEFLDYQTKAKLRVPFDGEWFVVWGGRTISQNYHAANRTQRFAMDLLVRRDGSSHEGDGKAFEDYHCYGLPVLAPGAGRVLAAVDSLPDQKIGETDRAHPAGNHVLIDLGHGEYVLLAHLQPGSLAVKPGEVVKPGQPLGRCGNSGNTSEPHIHMHLQNSPAPLEGDGLPAFFEDVLVDGKRVKRIELVRGATVAHAK
jgi:murein DD-endopeptidase MepM/ murein hydrolase activator NlpD